MSDEQADDEMSPSGGTESWRRRLLDVIDRADRHNRPSSGLIRALPGVLGGAIAAVVMWGLLNLSWPAAGPDPAAPLLINNDQGRQMLPELPQQQREMLDELVAFYDGKAAWVATTAQQVRFGVDDMPSSRSQPVVLRLTLSAPGDRIVYTDVAMLPGQTIDVPTLTPDGQAVSYRLTVVQHDRDAAPQGDTITLTAMVDNTASVTTRLPLAGAPVRPVGRLLTTSGTYEVHLGVASF